MPQFIRLTSCNNDNKLTLINLDRVVGFDIVDLEGGRQRTQVTYDLGTKEFVRESLDEITSAINSQANAGVIILGAPR